VNAERNTMVLARYTAEGSADPAFGQGGEAVADRGPEIPGDDSYQSDRTAGTTITHIGSNSTALGVAIQRDGKTVTASGAMTTENDFAVSDMGEKRSRSRAPAPPDVATG